jgi:predicted O-methyltransferase YrrM
VNIALRCLKAILPNWLGKALRRRHRALVFRRAMKVLLADPVESWRRDPRLLSELIYGWGNETFSAREEYLFACLEHAISHRGAILECGSGLTTVLVAAALRRAGGTIIALEHDAEWCKTVTDCLTAYHIESAKVVFAPLKIFGSYSWYDVPDSVLPKTLSVIICDGPPAGTPGGRYGVIPRMRSRLGPGSVVLLDDADREQEQAIANRWTAELGRRFEMFGVEKPYARFAI